MLHNRLSSVLSTLAVLLITACNADVPTASDNPSGAHGTSFQKAVTFGVSEVQAVSRAGFVGELDELFMRATGFGVYAYITTDNRTWASAGTTATLCHNGKRPRKCWPNQKLIVPLHEIHKKETAWEYTSIKETSGSNRLLTANT